MILIGYASTKIKSVWYHKFFNNYAMKNILIIIYNITFVVADVTSRGTKIVSEIIPIPLRFYVNI